MAAAIAATAAVGVASRVARAELERRELRRRRQRERHFGLLPHESPGEGVKRIAIGQLEEAIDQLSGGPPDSAAVHETRKALKRLRALVRLLEPTLPEGALSLERTTLREAGRRLAAVRDAEVLVSTFEGLLDQGPPKLARRRGVRRLHEQLEQERDMVRARLAGEAATPMQVLAALHTLRSRVPSWPLPAQAGLELLDPGLQRTYRQGRRRRARAARARGAERGRALHEWRKRVKDLRYAAEILERTEPPRGRERRGARAERKRLQREQRRIRKAASRADDLGELLGSEHDLAVLGARIEGTGQLGRGSARRLLRLIARRRRALRRKALRDGERLYGRKPRRFVRRMRRAYVAPSSADAYDRQLPVAAWQGNGDPLAGGSPDQRGRQWRVGGQAPFPRGSLVRADDAPALLGPLFIPHDHR